MSKREIDKYNQRQYERMIGLIEDYNNERLFIGKLINDLEALIDQLENVSKDQRNSLLSHWGLLEEVYAVSLDKGMTELDMEFKKLVVEALTKLKNVINEELALLKAE